MMMHTGGWSRLRGISPAWWLLILVVVVAVVAFISYTRPAKVVVDATGIPRSLEGFSCPTAWTQTKGEDPDGKLKTKTCTSPDKRYVITARENGAPDGYDGTEKRFMTPEEIATALK